MFSYEVVNLVCCWQGKHVHDVRQLAMYMCIWCCRNAALPQARLVPRYLFAIGKMVTPLCCFGALYLQSLLASRTVHVDRKIKNNKKYGQIHHIILPRKVTTAPRFYSRVGVASV